MPLERSSPPDQVHELDVVLEQLPPLPDGWLRLTHFTSEAIASKLIAGEDFSYESQGLLGQTTDPFSGESLSELTTLLETGKAGPFTRTTFGNCVILIDLESKEHKRRNSLTVRDQAVPNHNIVGFVKIIDRDGRNRYIFVPNPRYAPVVNELTVESHFLGQHVTDQNSAHQPIPAPAPAELETEVW